MLKEKHIDFDIVTTQGPGDAERLARELPRDEYRALVSMGGDGTLHEVVNGLLTPEKGLLPVTAIPVGTGRRFRNRRLHIHTLDGNSRGSRKTCFPRRLM